MSCLNERDYAELLAGRVRGAERVRIAVHVAECATCRARLREHRIQLGVFESPSESTVEVASRSDAALHPARAPRRVGRWRWGLRALILVLIALSVALHLEQHRLLRRSESALLGQRSKNEELRTQIADVGERAGALAHREKLGFASQALSAGHVGLAQNTLASCDPGRRGVAWQLLDHASDMSLRHTTLSAQPLNSLVIATENGDAQRPVAWVGAASGQVFRVDALRVTEFSVPDAGATTLHRMPLAEYPWLTCSEIGERRLWRSFEEPPSEPMLLHSGRVTATACSAKGEFWITGGVDERVRVWSLATWELQREIEVGAPVAGVEWFDDRRFLVATRDGGLITASIDPQTQPLRLEWREPIESTCSAAPREPGKGDAGEAGRGVWLGGRFGSIARVEWNNPRLEVRDRFVEPAAVTAMLEVDETLWVGRSDGVIRRWRAEQGRSWLGHAAAITALAFVETGFDDAVASPLLSVSADGTLRTWSPGVWPRVAHDGEDPVRELRVNAEGTSWFQGHALCSDSGADPREVPFYFDHRSPDSLLRSNDAGELLWQVKESSRHWTPAPGWKFEGASFATPGVSVRAGTEDADGICALLRWVSGEPIPESTFKFEMIDPKVADTEARVGTRLLETRPLAWCWGAGVGCVWVEAPYRLFVARDGKQPAEVIDLDFEGEGVVIAPDLREVLVWGDEGVRTRFEFLQWESPAAKPRRARWVAQLSSVVAGLWRDPSGETQIVAAGNNPIRGGGELQLYRATDGELLLSMRDALSGADLQAFPKGSITSLGVSAGAIVVGTDDGEVWSWSLQRTP